MHMPVVMPLEFEVSTFLPYLQGSESLIYTSANGQVVDCGVLDDSLSVNDEQTSESNALGR